VVLGGRVLFYVYIEKEGMIRVPITERMANGYSISRRSGRIHQRCVSRRRNIPCRLDG
jgi:hypothetical protein